MSIDMTGIKKSMVEILKVIRSQMAEVTRYRSKVAETMQSPYNSDYKSEKINELENGLKAFAQNNLKDMEKHLDVIVADCQANSKVFTIDDPKLQATIQLINTVGKGIDYDTRANIVNSFIGDQQALIMIKTLYKAKEIDEKEVNKYIFDAEGIVKDLKDLAWSIENATGKSMHFIVQFVKKLQGLAELNGISLSADEWSVGIDYNEYATQQARAAMGLPPVE